MMWGILLVFGSQILNIEGGAITFKPSSPVIVGPFNTTLCGRVEICIYNDECGTICDDLWDDDDAKVVCREMGLRGGTAYSGSYFGAGTKPILMSDVRCTGSESSLNDCVYSFNLVNYQINCDHSEDASVCCEPADYTTPTPVTTTPKPGTPMYHCPPSNTQIEVRLFGKTPGIGYVQAETSNGTWGFVCDDFFDLQAAKVFCREYCYTDAFALPYISKEYSVPVSNPLFVLDDVMCQGNESKLSKCRHRPYFQHNCEAHEIAAVQCVPLDKTNTSNNCSTSCKNPCKEPEAELECRMDKSDMIILFNLTSTPNLQPKHISLLNANACKLNIYINNVAKTMTIPIPFNACGTVLWSNSTHFVYNNTLIVNVAIVEGYITRSTTFQFQFNCIYARYSKYLNESGTVTIPYEQKTQIINTNLNRFFEIKIQLNYEADVNVTYIPDDCFLNSTIYMTTATKELFMVLMDCVVRPDSTDANVPSKAILQNKCVVDSSLKSFTYINQTYIYFEFQPFYFVGYPKAVLECSFVVCSTNDTKTDTCDTTCKNTGSTGRRRREKPTIKQTEVTARSPPFTVFLSNRTTLTSETTREQNVSTTTTSTVMTQTSTATSRLAAAFAMKTGNLVNTTSFPAFTSKSTLAFVEIVRGSTTRKEQSNVPPVLTSSSPLKTTKAEKRLIGQLAKDGLDFMQNMQNPQSLNGENPIIGNNANYLRVSTLSLLMINAVTSVFILLLYHQ